MDDRGRITHDRHWASIAHSLQAGALLQRVGRGVAIKRQHRIAPARQRPSWKDHPRRSAYTFQRCELVVISRHGGSATPVLGRDPIGPPYPPAIPASTLPARSQGMSESLTYRVGRQPRIATQRQLAEIAFHMVHKDEHAASGDDLPVTDVAGDQAESVDDAGLTATAESDHGDQRAGDDPGEPAAGPAMSGDVDAEPQAEEPVMAGVSPFGPGDDSSLDGAGDANDDEGVEAEAVNDGAVSDSPVPADDQHDPIDDALHRPPTVVLAPARSTRPLARLTWHYSAIFPVAVLALLTTLFLAPTSGEAETIAFRVLEDGTGAPLAGVEISVNDRVMTSDVDGIVHVAKTDAALPYRIEGDGFPIATGNLDPHGSPRQQVSIPRLASASTAGGAAASGASRAGAPGGSGQVDALQAATPPTSAPRPGKTRQRGTGDIEGTILSASGDPVRGARITDGKMLVVTGKDGLFAIDRAKLVDNASLTVSASGYADQVVDAADAGSPLDVTLEPRPINAIYMNPNISNTDADVDRLIDIIDTTDANAIVIDIKEELIFYDSQVEFFVDAGTVRPIIDLPALLKKFQDHDIYTIARLVVFKDSLVAENRPELAVLNNQTGDLWRDMNGVSWVNPMEHELWEANSDLAVEAAEIGFDEIQYDYVRFPTDGDLSTTDFGVENTQENRQNAIQKLLKMTREKLLPTSAKLSADVFGYTLLVDDDLGIGQNFINLAEYVDYLSPMVYPSHFPNGSIDVDGHPNDFPYETIEVSMRKGKEKLDGSAAQIRPWLQDFSFFDLMPYGDDEVRAQIDAAEDVGTSGWMLWDPNNEYHPGALDPEEAPAQPAALLPADGRSVSRGRRRRLHLRR